MAASPSPAGEAAPPASVAIVEPHPVVLHGLEHLLAAAPSLRQRGSYPDVAALLADLDADRPVDVVLLDLTFADRTSPRRNVARLTEAGIHVVALTDGCPYLHRVVVGAGARAVVHKTEPSEVLLHALAAAGRGERYGLLRGLDDEQEPSAALSPRERQTLALYAAGEKSERVAQRLGISRETVNDYISRIRAKYRMVGRPADTKVDLYKRAVEDGILPPPGYPES